MTKIYLWQLRKPEVMEKDHNINKYQNFTFYFTN